MTMSLEPTSKALSCHLINIFISWNSVGWRESPMKTTTFTTFKVLGLILLAISITLLFLAVMHFAQPLFASVGWHDLASIGWNG